jgi:hypothetical protein
MDATLGHMIDKFARNAATTTMPPPQCCHKKISASIKVNLAIELELRF